MPALPRVVVSSAIVAATCFACSDGAEVLPQETKPGAADDELVILTPYAEHDAPEFNDEIDRFEAETGTKVRVRSVAGDLVDELLLQLASDDPPDLAVISQPGVVQDLARDGTIVPLPAALEGINDDLAPGLRQLSTVDGKEYAVWTVGSLNAVWYRSDIFAANGWDIPRTTDEFEELMATIAASDYAPLCLGTSSDGATGWSITDYVELLMLARAGTEAYDRWVNLELPFTSLEVVEAMTTTQRWITDPAISLGREGIMEREVEDGFAMLGSPSPPCLMNFNSDWVLGALDDEIDSGAVKMFVPVDEADPAVPSIDAFSFPSEDPDEAALLLGGDQMVSMVDDPRAWELMEYVGSPQWGTIWAGTGSFVSPYADFDPSFYATPRQVAADAALEATPRARFDGSDMMPTEVGTVEMWGAMIDLLDGVPVLEVAMNLDEVAEPLRR